jgi:methylmalonyl-CoA mutase N-terminal domain/subunit
MDVDDFAGRLSFFFNAHNELFEEVAKYRAARRIWAKIMKERFGAKSERSLKLRFHTQTAGCTLTAQQPMNNIARVTIQALAAALGGTQSLHTNSFDEALALPSEQSARIALKTQQIVAYESGAADTVDPLAGSYYVESLTDDIEKRAWEYIEKIDAMGGAPAAIEQGYIQREIADSAFAYQKAIENDERVVVGLNKFTFEEEPVKGLLKIDPSVGEAQKARLAKLRASRDNAAVTKTLDALKTAAGGEDNLMPYIVDAARTYATEGEICGVLREVFGEYHPVEIL